MFNYTNKKNYQPKIKTHLKPKWKTNRRSIKQKTNHRTIIITMSYFSHFDAIGFKIRYRKITLINIKHFSYSMLDKEIRVIVLERLFLERNSIKICR